VKSFNPPLFALLIFLLVWVQTQAQPVSIDSLERRLKGNISDSMRAATYIALFHQYYARDTLKSHEFLAKAFAQVKRVDLDYLFGEYYYYKGIIREYATAYDESDVHYDSAIHFYKKAIDANRSAQEVTNSKLSIATVKGQKGDILAKNGRPEDGLALFLEALEAWKASPESNDRTFSLGVYYSKISTTYYDLGKFEKALEYDKLTLAQYLAGSNDENKALGYIYICDDFAALNQLDSAMVYLEMARPLVEKAHNHRLNVQYYNKLGQISRKKKEFRKAIRYYEKVIEEASATQTSLHIVSSQNMIAHCLMELGEYAAAKPYLLKALPVAISGKFVKPQNDILGNLVKVEEHENNLPAAYKYLRQLSTLKDSVNEDNSKKAVAEIESKYQAAEKGKEIIKLNADKKIQSLSLRQKSTLNYILIGSLFAVIALTILLFRNFRARQLLAKQQHELQEQRIRELEKDRQLVAVDSLLKGQEEERSRLAKDLHDGLGGLLSGVKFSLSNMKENLVITPENMTVFERSLDMIDTSIKELRRVAHNMMPEMLTKFGLDEALREYCNSINSAKLLTVKYQSLGMEVRLAQQTEIIVYRIIQELLNNTIKHSGASEAFVQLIKENNRLNVVMEDNGKGFDTAILDSSKGAGWTNIRSRVEYLKGQLDVHSDPGKGTLVNIEFNV
jgi:signal transduction histidine kinase